MNDRIEQAAQIASEANNGISEGACHIDHFRNIARALAEAGLLATGSEWRVRGEPQRIFADQGAAYKHSEGGVVESRGVTEWRSSE